jgi:YfiH family protein
MKTQFGASHVEFFDLEFNLDKNGLPFVARFPFVFNVNKINGITCCITSRYCGNMVLPCERSNLYDSLGIEERKIYTVRQIHSKTVYAVDSDYLPCEAGDGMVSNDRSVILSISVADCLPVYLYDTMSGAFGLVHSGWKGTGIGAEAVRMMEEKWQCSPENIAAVLGPCIGSCCYNVDKERASSFEREFSAESVRKTPPIAADNSVPAAETGETYFLDLKKANVLLLEKSGVRNIAVCGCCTFTDDRLGSYRREGPAKFTHMAALIGQF